MNDSSRSHTSILTHGRTDEFQARSPDELSLARGDRIELIERDDDFGDGWFLGRNTASNETGLFPEGVFSPHPRTCLRIYPFRGPCGTCFVHPVILLLRTSCLSNPVFSVHSYSTQTNNTRCSPSTRTIATLIPTRNLAPRAARNSASYGHLRACNFLGSRWHSTPTV